jgi:hypothetical protein
MKKGGNMTTARVNMVGGIDPQSYSYLFHFLIAPHGPAPPPH